MGAFDGVALMHPELKGFGALFGSTLLPPFVVLAPYQATVLFTGRYALGSQRAVLTAMLAPHKAVKDLHLAFLTQAQPAAVAARVTGRTAGLSMSDVHRKGFDGQAIYAGPALGWPGPDPSTTSLPGCHGSKLNQPAKVEMTQPVEPA
jgi:hypothetical protein